MEQSINIREYILIFRRRWWIIVLALALSIGAGVFITDRRQKAHVPIYQASTRIRVNTAKNIPDVGFNSGVAGLNQNVTKTYIGLAKSKSTLQEIITTVGLDTTTEVLKSQISLIPDEENPEFINITVTYNDKALATQIANTVPTAFNNELIKTIQLDCIQVIDLAVEPTNPLPAPQYSVTKKLVLVGLVCSIFIILLLEFLNNKIVTPLDVVEYWEVPLIGVVPYDKPSRGKKKEMLEVK